MAIPGYGGVDETTITGKNGKPILKIRRAVDDYLITDPGTERIRAIRTEPPRRPPRRRRHPPAGQPNPTPSHIPPLAQEPDCRTARQAAKQPHRLTHQPRMDGRGNRTGRRPRTPRRRRNPGRPPLPVPNAAEAQSRRPPGRAGHPAARADRPGLPPLRQASRPVRRKDTAPALPDPEHPRPDRTVTRRPPPSALNVPAARRRRGDFPRPKTNPKRNLRR